MKTRVLMFGWEFPPFNSGGLGVACLGLTKGLSQLGDEVTFVMPKKLDVKSPWAKMLFADQYGPEITMVAVNSVLQPYLTSEQYESIKLGRTSINMYGHNLLQEVLRYASAAAAIVKDEQFDVIYAHDWLSFPAGMEAKRISGKPLIVHVHATEFDRCGGADGVNRDVFEIEKQGMEMADSIIAVSELTKNIIVKYYGIPADKVKVVYNGIDESTAPEGSTGLPRLRQLKSAGYKLVLFLGRITLQKGPDYFIRVAKRVLDMNPKVLFILSGSGDMEASVMRLAAELGVADRVYFTGFLTGAERHEVYKVADLFIMPSVSEPFGITPLEAMRLGTPVLISKQSGVSEVVQHALKSDFWDVDSMTNQILSIVTHPGLSESLAENGVKEANTLTWNLAAQKVDNIMKELVH